MAAAVVVLDNGTASTKMGYAGNKDPTYVIPSVVAERLGATVPALPSVSASLLSGASGRGGIAGNTGVLADLDCHIGCEALAARAAGGWRATSPIQNGVIVDWDRMEKFWQQSIYQYLRVEPEELGFLITEAAGNPPECREYTAEVMFETFGVRQLHIAAQSTLALRALAGAAASGSRDEVAGVNTGLVVDCGAGVTSITPIVDGFVLSHAVRHVPLAGQHMTEFVLEKLRERKELLGSGNALAVAERAKEKYSYVCTDYVAELDAFSDSSGVHVVNPCHSADQAKSSSNNGFYVAQERFLAPEMLFHPGLVKADGVTPLPAAIDAAIWACPMDCRRPLYQNIVLCGGTTLLPGFDRRLEKELRVIVGARAERFMRAARNATGEISYEVNVIAHPRRLFAVFQGGSALGASPELDLVATTRQQYEEVGPRVMCENTSVQDL